MDGQGAPQLTALSTNEALATKQALALAAGQSLPFSARSLTAAEVARVDGRAPAVLLVIYALFAVPLLVIAGLSGGIGSAGTAIAVAVAAVLGAALWLVGRRRARRRRGYQDPQTVLEVGAEAATLHSPGRIDDIPYPGARVALNYVTMRGAPYFLGLVVETPMAAAARRHLVQAGPHRRGPPARAYRRSSSAGGSLPAHRVGRRDCA